MALQSKPLEAVNIVFNHILSICPETTKPILSEGLRNILQTINENEFKIDSAFMKDVMKSFFDLSAFNTKDDKLLLFTIESLVKAAIVYNLSILPEYIFETLTTEVELLAEYPSFMDDKLDSAELKFLLVYRNMMKIALEVIPSKGHKALLMNICAILEGSGQTYSTGGTQSKATTRRVLIYQQESRKLKSLTTSGQNNSGKAKKRTITCDICGSVILTRTMWKHKRSRKHLTCFHALKSRLQAVDCQI